MHTTEKLASTMTEIDAALQAGRFDQLDRLARQLDDDLVTLDQVLPTPEMLVQLRERSTTTMAMLAAAEAGVTAARRRLTELAAIRDGLVTYADDGRRQVFSTRNDHGHRA